jgi:hypothetical protein
MSAHIITQIALNIKFGIFDNLDNRFLNKYEKIEKKNIDIFFTYRLTVIQILCNFIIN